MTRVHKAVALALCLVLPTGGLLRAGAGLSTIDKPRYALVLADLKRFASQIKTIADVVGAARTVVDSLGSISAGIRDLQGVVAGGVRGLAADVSGAIGLNEILGPLRQVQGLYDDSQALMRDIRELPEEAKRQLRDIGLATDDVKRFLSEGLMYDTFQRLGADEWKQVATHPIEALKEGSFGTALCRAEDYLTPEQASAAWRSYLGGLSDSQKTRMSGLIGPQFAAHLASDWFKDMERRAKALTDLRKVTNAAEPLVAAASPKDRTISQDLQGASTVINLRTKIDAHAMTDDSKAALVIFTAEKERTAALSRIQQIERSDDVASGMGNAK